MIDFSFKKKDGNILLSLKTDSTEVGTFYRMTAVLYALGFDILSGEIQTIHENGTDYAFDTLLVKPESDSHSVTAQLGILMDSVFSKSQTLSELLQSYQIQEPPLSLFFKEKPEFLFEDDPVSQMTCFYLEAGTGRGLLYHISKILANNQVSIISGKIETDELSGRAKDSFYLVDKNGNPFGGTQLATELREQILIYKS